MRCHTCSAVNGWSGCSPGWPVSSSLPLWHHPVILKLIVEIVPLLCMTRLLSCNRLNWLSCHNHVFHLVWVHVVLPTLVVHLLARSRHSYRLAALAMGYLRWLRCWFIILSSLVHVAGFWLVMLFHHRKGSRHGSYIDLPLVQVLCVVKVLQLQVSLKHLLLA